MSAPTHKKIEVLLPVPFDQTFTYRVPENCVVMQGDYVQVSFGNRTLVGVAWKKAETVEEMPDQIDGVGIKTRARYILKPLLKKFELPPLSAESIRFVEWVAQYYMAPLGAVLKMVMAEPLVFKEGKQRVRKDSHMTQPIVPVVLSNSQQRCVSSLKEKMSGFYTVLLEGTTGSGKTEVYLELIKEVLEKGRQAVVLLPEIALSAQWVARFEKRFGEKPLLWHSDLTPSQRRENWKKIADGKALVVVGARSALFLPYPHLGLIVVDEEHDVSYKQESGVFYHARDMAVMRGSVASCLVVLASATPSLETVVNVEQGRYGKCHLDQRYGEAGFPDVSLIDRRTSEGRSVQGGSQWISEPLYKAMQNTLMTGNQILLFLNRRGYAPLLLCQACGERTACRQCDAWLVYHKSQHKLQCHHCGHVEKPKTVCCECGAENSLIPCGPGVERVLEEVMMLFPEARTMMMTSDTMTTMKQSEEMIRKIEQQEVDIIVGTQVMAKGHHFPHLTLVGVVDGDLGLGGADLRLVERTYQLLHQVAGRSGRAEKKGRVLIQSHMGDHPVMKALLSQDPAVFLELEKESRQTYGFPPYGRLAAIILSGRQAHHVEEAAKKMAMAIPRLKEIEVLGPVPAAMSRLKGQYRWRFLVKSARTIKLQPFIKQWMESCKMPSRIRIQIDMDPYSFY